MPWNVKHIATCLVMSIHSLYFFFSWLLIIKSWKQPTACLLIISSFLPFLSYTQGEEPPYLAKRNFKLLKYLVEPVLFYFHCSFLRVLSFLSLSLSSPKFQCSTFNTLSILLSAQIHNFIFLTRYGLWGFLLNLTHQPFLFSVLFFIKKKN